LPEKLPRSVLCGVDAVIAVGDRAEAWLRNYCDLVGAATPRLGPPIGEGEPRALVWNRALEQSQWIRRLPAKAAVGG
jgi:hypothetical protein